MNEILPVLQQANAESRLQVDDHDPTAATESNKLLEDVNSLFKEVIDGIPDLVGGVDELKTKLVQTLTYNVSPQETEVGNDNAEMKETMDVDIEDGKYCLDDMSIGFEEDTSNGEIKVTLYQEDHKALCNKMDVAIEGKTLVTETSPVIETRVVDSTLKYQIMNMPEENLVKVNDTTSLKMGFYVVRRKRKPGVALQSPYEQQQSTTPTPAKKGEQLQKKKDGEPTMNCSNWLGIHMALLLMINSGFGWSCYGALDHRMQIEHNKAHCCKPYWLVVIPIYHANAKRGSVSWTDVDKVGLAYRKCMLAYFWKYKWSLGLVLDRVFELLHLQSNKQSIAQARSISSGSLYGTLTLPSVSGWYGHYDSPRQSLKRSAMIICIVLVLGVIFTESIGCTVGIDFESAKSKTDAYILPYRRSLPHAPIAKRDMTNAVYATRDSLSCQSLTLVIAKVVYSAPISAYLNVKAKISSQLRRFKEGFGRCIDAEREKCFLMQSAKRGTSPLRVRAFSHDYSLGSSQKILKKLRLKRKKLENIKSEELGNVVLKMLNFQKAIREQKLGYTVRMEPFCLHWQELSCYGDLRSVIMHEFP
ncbi:hypothetical protein Tco_0990092 [Tanacetum coccineum]|uniref:Uncharacterized protein n=1 Tax=Tanacetum coccineum TaxID=301880 RepID=A0ABQ5EWA4_9ASTR